MILGIEDAAEDRIAANVAAEQRKAQAREEQRLRVEQVKANYEHALVEDLDKMVERHEQAQTLRAFLRAVDAAVPPPERTAGYCAWIEWAEARAAELDPLTKPQSISKVVRLDFSRLSKQQFEGWLKRVPGGSAR